MRNGIAQKMPVAVGTLLLAIFLITTTTGCGDDNPAAPGTPMPGSMTIMSQRDTDGDGMIDLVDPDDDNDGVTDDLDADDDGDGIVDIEEADHDGDGIINDHDDDYAEVEGAISALGDGTATVYGITFVVDETTEVVDENEFVVGFEMLEIGMWVEAEGTMQTPTRVLAMEIEMESPPSEGTN